MNSAGLTAENIQTAADQTSVSFGHELPVGMYVVLVKQGAITRTVKVVKN